MSRKQTKKKSFKVIQPKNRTMQKVRTILKFDRLKDILSDKILSGYVLPIARNVESKLVNLKNKLDGAEES